MPSANRPPEATHENAQALLRRLEWTALRRLDGLLQGDYRTLMRGSGLDLADLREYQWGDDVRHIDWNVTARSATPHVRVFTEDREMAACFLLDCSGSMGFGSGASSKLEVQRQFTALMGRILTRHGNRVGALLGSDAGLRWVPARTGRPQMLRVLQEMDDSPPVPKIGRASKSGRPAPFPLHHWLEAAVRGLKRRSTVLVISDFLADAGWERALGQLGQRHDVVAVRVVDPLERQLPDIGLVTLQDAETGEQMWVDTHDRRFRERFELASAARESSLRQRFAAARVDTLELATDDDLVEAVMRFSDLRRRRIRQRGGLHRQAHRADGASLSVAA